MTMIIDGTNGLTFNNATTQASAGQVLQVVNATTSTQVIINTNTYTDTTLTATITPKFATSKILVLLTQPYNVSSSASTSGTFAGIQLLRNGTAIYTPVADSGGPYMFSVYSTTTNNPGYRAVWNLSYLDSPATTSAVIYKTQGRRYNSNSSITVQENDSNGNSISTITLMEIAA
jgi:hypothetical protein